jgi:hypothetical protein
MKTNLNTEISLFIANRLVWQQEGGPRNQEVAKPEPVATEDSRDKNQQDSGAKKLAGALTPEPSLEDVYKKAQADAAKLDSEVTKFEKAKPKTASTGPSTEQFMADYDAYIASLDAKPKAEQAQAKPTQAAEGKAYASGAEIPPNQVDATVKTAAANAAEQARQKNPSLADATIQVPVTVQATGERFLVSVPPAKSKEPMRYFRRAS